MLAKFKDNGFFLEVTVDAENKEYLYAVYDQCGDKIDSGWTEYRDIELYDSINTYVDYILKYCDAKISDIHGEYELLAYQTMDDYLSDYSEHIGQKWIDIVTKQVRDESDFLTDYTMYKNIISGEYVFIFGDNESYNPENSEPDWECETEQEAWEWFNSYKGFEEVDPNEIYLYSLPFLNDAFTECAIEYENGYIIVQECTDGYDYTIASKEFHIIDGGVYDNPEVSIIFALNEVLKDAEVKDYSTIKPADYEVITEQIELAEEERIMGPEVYSSRSVIDYKVQTQRDFVPIGCQNADEVEETASCYIQNIIDECGLDAEIVGLAITGSRSRGLEHEGSDLDIVVEMKSSMKEDELFNILNEDGVTIAGVKVDINPILADKTGTLESYLVNAEKYLADKKEQLKTEVISVPSEEITEIHRRRGR